MVTGNRLFHAAMQTDYEGQAKKLMELLEHTDMLIVAGGDGTLQEVLCDIYCTFAVLK